MKTLGNISVSAYLLFSIPFPRSGSKTSLHFSFEQNLLALHRKVGNLCFHLRNAPRFQHCHLYYSQAAMGILLDLLSVWDELSAWSVKGKKNKPFFKGLWFKLLQPWEWISLCFKTLLMDHLFLKGYDSPISPFLFVWVQIESSETGICSSEAAHSLTWFRRESESKMASGNCQLSLSFFLCHWNHILRNTGFPHLVNIPLSFQSFERNY